MNPTKPLSCQAQGAANAEKLRKWIAVTPFSAIPVNQFGVSSKKTICDCIGIPKSTIHSNKALRNLFQLLDEELSTNPILGHAGTPDTDSRSSSKNSDSWYQVKALSDENEKLRLQLARLRYLENTGRLVSDI